MAREDHARFAPDLGTTAHISLVGPVDEAMASRLRDALADPPESDAPLIIDMTTLGGDPEMARRMIAEIDRARIRSRRRIVFIGKTAVYSAGCTFMAAFEREDRYLTADARLLVHCRQSQETVQLAGPIRSHIPLLKARLHEYETGVALEVENFERLIAGSDIAMDELVEKALHNWYLPAKEAAERGLVAGVI